MKTQQQKAAEMVRDAGYARGGPPRIAYNKGRMDVETDTDPAAVEGKPTVDVVLAVGKGKGGASQGMPPQDDGTPMSRRGRLRNGGAMAKGGKVTAKAFEQSGLDDDRGVKEGSAADMKRDKAEMAEMAMKRAAKRGGKMATGGKVGDEMDTPTKPAGGIPNTMAKPVTEGAGIDRPMSGKMDQTGGSVPKGEGSGSSGRFTAGAGSGVGRMQKARMA